MIKKKTLSVFILFVLQVFFLDAYGSSKKVNEKINSEDKLEKKPYLKKYDESIFFLNKKLIFEKKNYIRTLKKNYKFYYISTSIYFQSKN